MNRKEGTWSINPYRCIQCAYCVSECPKDCLSMSTERPLASAKVETVVVHKETEPKPAATGTTGAGDR